MDPTTASAEASVPAPPVRGADARRAAVVAGISTFAMAVFGMYGNLVVLGLLADGPEGSGSRLVASATSLRLAIVAMLIVVVLDIVLAWAILRFFGADAERGLPVLAAWLRVAYAAVLAVAVGDLALAANTHGQTDAAFAALLAFQTVWQIGLVVFAAHLVVLGLLLIRARSTPTILGGVILLAGFAYAFDGVARIFLATDSPVLTAATGLVAVSSIVGEVGLGIWFLVSGGRAPRRRPRSGRGVAAGGAER